MELEGPGVRREPQFLTKDSMARDRAKKSTHVRNNTRRTPEGSLRNTAGAARTPRHDPPRGGKGFSPATCLENRHEVFDRLQGRACGPVIEPVPVRPMNPSLVGNVVIHVDALVMLRSVARLRGRRWRGTRRGAGPRSWVSGVRVRLVHGDARRRRLRPERVGG